MMEVAWRCSTKMEMIMRDLLTPFDEQNIVKNTKAYQ
jgi:hypothetical protein